MTPLHKKGQKDKKYNCRPVSILPTLSKCFEKYMFSQMSAYSDETFSKYQYGFFVNPELLIAKLNAYGFTLPTSKLVHDYLSDKKQRTRVKNSYSIWFEILFGVPQRSIFGPLLFNIFLADER